jgi:hypothetical protein
MTMTNLRPTCQASPLQQWLWRGRPADSRPVFVQARWSMEGPADRTRLAAAVQQVGDHHEILRTTFTGLSSGPH